MMMGQRAAASAARIYEILDEPPEIVDRPGAVDLVDPDGRRRASTTSRSRYARRARRCSTGFDLAHRAGRDGGARRPHRQRQVDRRPPADPLLRRRRRRVLVDGHDVRDLTLAEPARATSGSCSTSRSCSRCRSATTSPTAGPTRRLDEVVAAAEAAQAHEFIEAAARGLRHGHRRAGLHAVGRPAPAHRHRPDAAGQPARSSCSTTPPAPSTCRSRSRSTTRSATLMRRPHDARHRPPPLDDQPRRPGRAVEGGAVVADRHPRRAAATEPRYAEVLAHVAEDEERRRWPRPMRPELRREPESDSPAGAELARAMGSAGPTAGSRSAAAERAAPPGLPFAGDPARAGRPASRTSSTTEPEHRRAEHVQFSQRRADDRRPLTLRRFLAPHRLGAARRLRASSCSRPLAMQAGPAADPDRHRPRHHARATRRRSSPSSSLYLVAVVVSVVAERPAGRAGPGRRRRAPHVRAAGPGLLPPPAAVARLLHRARRPAALMTRMTSDIESLTAALPGRPGQTSPSRAHAGRRHRRSCSCCNAALAAHHRCSLVVPAMPVADAVVPARRPTAATTWCATASPSVLADLQESLSGIRVIAAHNRRRHNVVAAPQRRRRLPRRQRLHRPVGAIYGPGTEVIGILGQALMLLIGGNMVLDGHAHDRRADRVRALPHRVLRPDPAAGPALQHVPAGPGGAAQAARPAATRARRVPEAPDAVELPPIARARSSSRT